MPKQRQKLPVVKKGRRSSSDELKVRKPKRTEPKGKYTRPIEVPGSPGARAIGGLGLGRRDNKQRPNYYMLRDVVEYKSEPLGTYLKSKNAQKAWQDMTFETTVALDKLVNGKDTR